MIFTRILIGHIIFEEVEKTKISKKKKNKIEKKKQYSKQKLRLFKICSLNGNAFQFPFAGTFGFSG